MEHTGLRPEQMLALIPKHYRKSAVLACPWEKKGETLRRIAEKLGGLAEMTEGFKIFDERGTIWICPDSDAPLLRVIAESGSREHVSDLLGHYVADVERVLN
jgi:mannose-1-phosphate guanylyltransferase/phosphomannomutase